MTETLARELGDLNNWYMDSVRLSGDVGSITAPLEHNGRLLTPSESAVQVISDLRAIDPTLRQYMVSIAIPRETHYRIGLRKRNAPGYKAFIGHYGMVMYAYKYLVSNDHYAMDPDDLINAGLGSTRIDRQLVVNALKDEYEFSNDGLLVVDYRDMVEVENKLKDLWYQQYANRQG